MRPVVPILGLILLVHGCQTQPRLPKDTLDWQPPAEALTDWRRLPPEGNAAAINTTKDSAAPKLMQLEDVVRAAESYDMSSVRQGLDALLARQGGQVPLLMAHAFEAMEQGSWLQARGWIERARVASEGRFNGEIATLFEHAEALAALHGGQPREGRRLFAALLGRNPQYRPAYFALAQDYLDRDELRAAEFVILRGLEQNPEDAGLLMMRAAIALKQRQFAPAHTWLQTALEKGAPQPAIFLNLAQLCVLEADLPKAQAWMHKALKVSPSHPQVLLAAALLAAHAQDLGHAREYLERLSQLNPADVQGRYLLAHVDLVQGRRQEGLRRLSEVVGLGNDAAAAKASQDLEDALAAASTPALMPAQVGRAAP